MSKNADYSVKELSENAFFVQILSNYPNMFQRPITKSERARQEYARYALTHTFNEKCKTNLTIKQISRKINNMKARLKDKNARHLLGAKTVKYHDWERLFLKLWTGIDHFPLQFGDETENTERSSFQNSFNPENIACNSTDYYSYKTNQQKSPTTTPTTPPSPTEFKTKIEPEVNDIESVSDVSNAPHWKIEIDQPETTQPPTDEKEEQFNDIHNDDEDDDDDDDDRDDYMDDDDYEKMSMEKLRRIALISQTKMYKAQESAARSKEKLNEYKLMILKRTHEGNVQK